MVCCTRRVLRMFCLLDESLYRPLAHLVVRQRDRRERGPKVGRDEFLVIEPDNCHISRNMQAMLL